MKINPDNIDPRLAKAIQECCGNSESRWYLCQYHDGFADGLDAIGQPRLPTRSEVELAEQIEKMRAAILDIDAHATPLGTDEHGFNAIGYAISVGCLHRALGIIGHPAAPCTGDHEHCPKCGTRPVKGLGGWDSVACPSCGGTGRPSSTYGWATEDPEPEVDPPVDELDVSFLRDLLAKIDGRAAQNQALGYSDYARWLLQSGAITVSRELRAR